MNTRTILVVDDDQDIRDNLADLLLDEGYTVQVAGNGQEALDRLKAEGALPNMILLDLMMPVKDGFAFREEQERDVRLAAIPVVIMTADANIEDKQARLRAKAAIRKPFDLDLLLRLVDRHSR